MFKFAKIAGVLLAMRAEDVELTLAGGALMMKGRRADLEGVSDHRFRRQERPQGAWQRSIPIPDRVQDEKLSAEFNDGILTVHLPKAEELKPRQIPVVQGND